MLLENGVNGQSKAFSVHEDNSLGNLRVFNELFKEINLLSMFASVLKLLNMVKLELFSFETDLVSLIDNLTDFL